MEIYFGRLKIVLINYNLHLLVFSDLTTGCQHKQDFVIGETYDMIVS